jgi:pimeloyl-ACP methyl ester carboxylesterase
MSVRLLFLLSLFAFCQVKAQESVAIIEEAVTFSGREAVYSGTLSRPAGTGPFSLVILVSGMGLQDRDWTFIKGKYQLAKMLSDSLNRQGIAVLRYDDRGHKQSTGSLETLTSFEDLAADVYAAVSAMKKRKDVSRVGLLGHSLGGILSIMAASAHSDIDFVITLAGSYQNGNDIMMEQAQTLKRWRTNANMSEAEVVANGQAFVRNWSTYANGGKEG